MFLKILRISFILKFFSSFFIEFCSWIRSHPNVTEFDNRTKLSSLKFIDEVVHVIGALDEVGFVRVYAKLDLDHDSLPVQKVYEDIPGFCFELIFDFHNFRESRILEVDLLDFIVESNNFFLL